MGKRTGIAWTRSTRNFWSGCTKIGPGCDGCYAEASSRRMRGVDATTGQAINWGVGAARVPHLVNAEADVRKWDRLAALEQGGGVWRNVPRKERREGTPPRMLVRCFTDGWPRPGFWPVFLNSYSDTFDNAVPQMWRQSLFTTVEECPHLHFQLVTKRVGNVRDMLEGRWRKAPANVWLLITVVNQEELDRDGPKLLELAEELGFAVIGLSMEPQLAPINVNTFLSEANVSRQKVWGICGGESSQPGHPARPFRLEWAVQLAADFRAYGQPFFFKQAGSNSDSVTITGKGDDPAEWPGMLRIQEFPL